MTIITKERVAEIMGVTPATVLRLARKDKIPSKHLSKKIVIFIEEKIMERLSEDPAYIKVKKLKNGGCTCHTLRND